MTTTVQQLTVLYDEGCELCRRSRDWLATQPTYVPLRLVASGSHEAQTRYRGLPLKQELVVADQAGRVWVGGPAFLMCLWATRRWRNWSYRLSGDALQPLAERFFDHVSKRRKRISRWLEREKSCEACVPDPPVPVHRSPARTVSVPAPVSERLVVATDQGAAGYSIEHLARHRLVQDRIGGVETLAIVTERPRRWGVFDRRLDGRTLSFEARDGRLVDVQTGSAWNPNDASAISGPLAGRRLTRVPAELVSEREFRARWPEAKRWPQ